VKSYLYMDKNLFTYTFILFSTKTLTLSCKLIFPRTVYTMIWTYPAYPTFLSLISFKIIKLATWTATSILKKIYQFLPHEKQDRNCQLVINIWSWSSDGARQQDLLTDRQSQCDFDSDGKEYNGVQRSTKEYKGGRGSTTEQWSSVQLEVRIVPVECPVGRWQCVR
jgi:hypothetical protein